MIAKKSLLIPSLLTLIMVTNPVFAERNGFRGGNPGLNRGNDAINRANENALIHRDYNNNPDAVIVAPVDSCSTQEVCDDPNDCWTEQNCD